MKTVHGRFEFGFTFGFTFTVALSSDNPVVCSVFQAGGSLSQSFRLCCLKLLNCIKANSYWRRGLHFPVLVVPVATGGKYQTCWPSCSGLSRASSWAPTQLPAHFLPPLPRSRMEERIRRAKPGKFVAWDKESWISETICAPKQNKIRNLFITSYQQADLQVLPRQQSSVVCNGYLGRQKP